MFRGINEINLDGKGRMIMPSRYRERLQQKGSESQLVVTIDTEATCLLLYPLPEWEIIEKKIEALPSFNQVTRRIQRLLIGHATEVEMDNNGRLLLPPLLREYAKLEADKEGDRRVILVGQGKKFEIWARRSWQEGRDVWLSEHANQTGGLPSELQSLAL